MRVEVLFDGDGRYMITKDGAEVAPGPGPLPAPPVLFLGSLAACAGVYAVGYLKSRGLPFAGLKVIGEAEYVEEPRRFGDMKVDVLLPAAVESKHLGPLHRSVDLCLLKNTLVAPPGVATRITAPAMVN